MRLLLGSGGFRTPERLDFLRQTMRSFFGPIQRLLFVPYALADHDEYVRVMVERGLDAGYALEGIHRAAEGPVEAVRRAEGAFVGGGNTFRLLDALYRTGVLEVLRERVRGGLPFLGVSAGCNIACPSIKTTNDMPIVEPPGLAALGLVPFQVNPHYYPGNHWLKVGEEFVEHFGETRDERLAQFHEMNDVPVLGLWEAGIVRVEDGRAELLGAPARLFIKGQQPRDVAVGARLDELLR